MDIRTAYEVCYGKPAPTGSLSPDPETRRVVNHARYVTEQAKALGYYKAAEQLLHAQINVDAFMRGMLSVEGAQDAAREARSAAEQILVILDQVEA